MTRKTLILELWGLGDLTFSTALIKRAFDDGHEVHLLGKGHAPTLLGPTFPKLRFHRYDAPWTAHRGKYRLWKWDWKELTSLIRRLRKEKFDAIVSVRRDPRDHLLMRFIGATQRVGFPSWGSQIMLLNKSVAPSQPIQHKVDDWADLAAALQLSTPPSPDPTLTLAAYRSPRVEALLARTHKPVLCIHTGARIPVRRWPEPYFEAIFTWLRSAYDFHIILIPDPDGYGRALTPLADEVAEDLEMTELVELLGRSSLIFCNDSGPGHIAAALQRPVVAVFGPTEPKWFRPWGDQHKVIMRGYCPWRPCFDYCPFSEPYCMTQMKPEEVWPEIEAHLHTLMADGILPPEIQRAVPLHSCPPLLHS